MRAVEHPFAWLVCIGVAVVLFGCRKEERRFRDSPAAPHTEISQGDLYPGTTPPAPSMDNPYEGNAHALAEGKRLYAWFNCNGCHFNGGGGIGPALMDKKWIYGDEPANIYSSIIEGRPDGMPSYRGRLNEQQVWQLVTYVRSLGGIPAAGKPPDRQHLPAKSDPATSDDENPPSGD